MAHPGIGDPVIIRTEGDLLKAHKLKPLMTIYNERCCEVLLVMASDQEWVRHAVKKFTLQDIKTRERNIKAFQAEVKFMQSFDHPYLMKCLFAGRCTEYLAIGINYFHCGALDRYVGAVNHLLSEKCVIQVACALRYMHKHHVAHLDVKLDNIFMDYKDSAILGCFEFAEEFLPHRETLPKNHSGGTTCYYAPERRGAQDGTQMNPYKLDSYCLGIVLWALVLEREPDEDVNYYMEATKRQDLPSHLREWLLSLLESDPSNRPTITESLTVLRQKSTFRNLLDNL